MMSVAPPIGTAALAFAYLTFDAFEPKLFPFRRVAYRNDLGNHQTLFRVDLWYQVQIVPCGASTLVSLSLEFTRAQGDDEEGGFIFSSSSKGFRESPWSCDVNSAGSRWLDANARAVASTRLAYDDSCEEGSKPFVSQHAAPLDSLRTQIISALPSSSYLSLSDSDTAEVEIDTMGKMNVAITGKDTAGWGTWEPETDSWSNLRHKHYARDHRDSVEMADQAFTIIDM